MEEKKVRTKEKKDLKTQQMILELSNKLNLLESQVKERDEKLTELSNSSGNKSGTGFKKFGISEWESYSQGEESGPYRSLYINIRSLMGQNQR